MIVVRAANLMSGISQSCGCLRSELTWAARKHRVPQPLKKQTEHRSWYGMIRRCHAPIDEAYPKYGGRGIIVCDRWRFGEDGLSGYQCFLSDMGKKPNDAMSLDRINNDGNYAPDNCRWASPTEQTRNRRNTLTVNFDGQEIPLGEACERVGLPHNVVRQRLLKGWAPSEALSRAKRAYPTD